MTFRTRVPARPFLLAFITTLLFAGPHAAFAATRTWTGTNSGSWSDSANWGGSAVAAGDDLVFPSAASNKSNTNDLLTGTLINSITFTGTGYTLSGNPIALGAGGIVQNVSAATSNAILFDIALGATRSILFPGTGSGVINFGGVFSGVGGLTLDGGTASNSVGFAGASTFSGGISANDISIAAQNDAAFGTGTVTEAAASVTIVMSGHTIANALNLQGCGLSGNSAVNSIGTLTGPVTITGNTCLGGVSSSPGLVFTGAFTGSTQLTAPNNTIDSVVTLAGTSPGFTGTLRPFTGTLFVTGSMPSASATFTGAFVGATLGGTGTVGGGVTVQSGFNLSPGVNAPGMLNTGNLALQAGSIFNVELNGATAGSGYDQVKVTGSVALGGTLNLSLGFIPAPGTQFVIIDNDGADPVTGTFTGLAEGAQLSLGGNIVALSYAGGSGNDVVLTVVQSVPALPVGWRWMLAAALIALSARAIRRRLA